MKFNAGFWKILGWAFPRTFPMKGFEELAMPTAAISLTRRQLVQPGIWTWFAALVR